jgi:hypothetical protein
MSCVYPYVLMIKEIESICDNIAFLRYVLITFLPMQKHSTFAMVIIAVAAMAGILGIGAATTMITAYGQTSQEQPPVTSNDECLPGSVVHCIDDEENPPNSNEECLPGSAVHCIDDDHGNLRDLFELNVDELLQLDVNDLLERFGHNN